MALFSSSSNKTKQIELQNIIFGTNEKKLMVSPEFLTEMTKHYITKRMKSINHMMESIIATKSPRSFFTYYDSILENLDELIVLEKYHSFKSPIPSEFKKGIESKRERYTESMINRAWKEANIKANYDPKAEQKRSPEDFADILDEMLEYKDRYTSALTELVNKFYKSVYEHGINDFPQDKPVEEPVIEEVPEEFTEMEFNELPEE